MSIPENYVLYLPNLVELLINDFHSTILFLISYQKSNDTYLVQLAVIFSRNNASRMKKNKHVFIILVWFFA